MRRAVDLVGDLRSQALLDEKANLELTLLAVALDDAATRTDGDEHRLSGEAKHRPSLSYEKALCRFFTRVAEVLVKHPAADSLRWVARVPRPEDPEEFLSRYEAARASTVLPTGHVGSR